MPFSTGEDERGARLIGADRATWLRLGVAVALGVAAFGAPRIPGTAAAYTDSVPSTGSVSTSADFEQQQASALDAPRPIATPTPGTEPSVAPTTGATDD